MSKKYNGKDMSKSSRFIEYLKTMSEVDLRKVEDKINILIKENKEYCDKGNYQHLSNIFTCMALYNTLKDDGMSENEAVDLVFNTMYKYMETQKVKFQKLAKHGWFWPLIKKIVPLGFKKGSGYGWAYTWHKDSPKNEFRFECNKCIYKPIFSKYGLYKFGPKFCHNDIIVYGELPRTNFIRTKTLSYGDEVCDFKFIRYKDNEEFKRSKSI
ncbi:MAG: L-2-amino-thiazoline-4-carboxylic acid hydrolase [Clostridia bacterium]|nr:L-2-amino-thiazoline-4-carboxylic acid hydrolase [Clostridia bacterium]